MSEARSAPTYTRQLRGVRLLGAIWLVAAVPVGLVAFMLVAVSDHAGDRVPGLILSALAVAGLAVGAWLIDSPGRRSRVLSMVTSALWLAGAVAVYPTQEFAADAAWAAGVPGVVALITAGIALVGASSGRKQ